MGGVAVFFEPVLGRRLSAQIAEQLQTAIFSGALSEGDRLPPERELAERFQASRPSVQAAIRQLELTGLVTIRRGSGGGAFVTKPDFGRVSEMLHTMLRGNHFEIGDLYEARLLIEPGIAEIAAQRATNEDIDAMRAFVASGRIDRPQRSAIGRNFHYLLARATGNKLLVMLVSSLLSVAEATPTGVRTSSVESRHAAHDLIVDAIERRDGVAARRFATEHLTDLLREVTGAASPVVKGG